MTIRKTGFALVALLALAGCRIEVYDQLSQRDANEITALLLTSSIDAKRVEEKDGTFAVEVPEGDFATAVQLISDSGLPRPQFSSMTDVFDNDRLISSPSEERARLGYAVSQELSQTVSEIDGVVSARVHLATPAVDPLGRRVNKSSASVAIHHEQSLPTDGLVPRIKLLVSHAVDDLEYDDVLVALFPVGRTLRNGNGDASRNVAARSVAAPRIDSGNIVDEMARPNDGNRFFAQQATGGQPTTARAAVGDSSSLNPAIAVILAGGLLVLMIAAKGLFDRPGRSGARALADAAPAPARPAANKRRRS